MADKKPYNWKKALINGGVIFGGVIMARTGMGTTIPFEAAFWVATIKLAATTTAAAEFRYVYGWLMSLDNGNGRDIDPDVSASPPAPPPGPINKP